MTSLPFFVGQNWARKTVKVEVYQLHVTYGLLLPNQGYQLQNGGERFTSKYHPPQASNDS